MNPKKYSQNPWAKDTLLGDWLRICIKFIGTFFLGAMLVITCTELTHKPTKVTRAQGWKNWDPSIDPGLILDLDYNTGEVTYRKRGPGYELPIERETFQDQMTEYVLENIDIEQLWDRISDEGYLVE